jgi:hypothetical protein
LAIYYLFYIVPASTGKSVNALNSYRDVFAFHINKESFGAEDESTSTAALTVIVPRVSTD